MSRRLLALPLVLLGLLTAAPSALGAGPTAIGTDYEGYSYVGYATGGGIQRFAPGDGSSTARPAWGAAGDAAGLLGGVVGIGVGAGPDGNVWIVDEHRRVQEFTKSGTYLRGIQLPACESGKAPIPGTYGGIDVRADNTADTTKAVYVAHPCADRVYRINPGTLAIEAERATTSRPGHLAAQRYTSASQQTRGVFVALPDEKKVTSFDLDSLAPLTSGTSTRSFSYTPTDVFIDAYGVLFVGSKEDGRIYLYNDQGGEIRWIGGGGTDVGRLTTPQAFDVFWQYSDFAGNVFIADSGNSRVQRMNPYGYTFWASAATGTSGGPGDPGAQPPTAGAPSISGSAVVGQTLTCNPGAWTGSPSFSFSWRRGGVEVATTSTYTVVSAEPVKSGETCWCGFY